MIILFPPNLSLSAFNGRKTVSAVFRIFLRAPQNFMPEQIPCKGYNIHILCSFTYCKTHLALFSGAVITGPVIAPVRFDCCGFAFRLRRNSLLMWHLFTGLTIWPFFLRVLMFPQCVYGYVCIFMMMHLMVCAQAPMHVNNFQP